MYEFWYDYIKPKYRDSAKLYYISLILKPKIFFEDMANDVAERFDASNYEVDKPLPTGKNKKVIKIDER